MITNGTESGSNSSFGIKSLFGDWRIVASHEVSSRRSLSRYIDALQIGVYSYYDGVVPNEIQQYNSASSPTMDIQVDAIC